MCKFILFWGFALFAYCPNFENTRNEVWAVKYISAVNRSLFEIWSPDFAWKFIWTVPKILTKF